MSSTAMKRIMQKDMRSIQTHALNDLGIYIEFNEENILEAVAMIIAPEDSVYKYGILYFKIDFPTNYPFSPPKVNYISRGSIRIHPNLYTGTARDNYVGKVCISILGTWSGPQWTTVMDISSVLLSIQSLLTNNPLENEPGFEGKHNEIHDNYKACVVYETCRTLINKNIFDIPEPFLCFKDIIRNHCLENKECIKALMQEYETTYKGSIVYIPVYRIKLILDFKPLNTKFLSLLET